MARPTSAKPTDPCRAQLALTAVSLEFGIPDLSLNEPRGGDSVRVYARQVAIYLAHVALGLTVTRVAQLFARDRATAAHAIRLVEGHREDPVIGDKITRLEHWLGLTPGLWPAMPGPDGTVAA